METKTDFELDYQTIANSRQTIKKHVEANYQVNGDVVCCEEIEAKENIED